MSLVRLSVALCRFNRESLKPSANFNTPESLLDNTWTGKAERQTDKTETQTGKTETDKTERER